jgi:hypothetical protein
MYSLPPKLDEIFRQLQICHRRRLNIAVMIFFALVLVGILLTNTKDGALESMFVAYGVFMICCTQAIRLSGRQSIAAGFICPRCGKALYNGRYSRFGRIGECPNCKQFVADELAQQFG